MRKFSINRLGQLTFTNSHRRYKDEAIDFYRFSENKQSLLSIYSKYEAAYKDYNFKDLLSFEYFKKGILSIYARIAESDEYKQLLDGPSFPFAQFMPDFSVENNDFLNERLFPLIERSINSYGSAKFSTRSHDNIPFAKDLRLYSIGAYGEFCSRSIRHVQLGILFPSSLIGYGVDTIQELTNVMDNSEHGLTSFVSGGIDVFSSMIGSPNLLINESAYTPILTLPQINHIDDRLITVLKSYGTKSIELWLLPKLISPGNIQLSEQFTGSLTFTHQL